MANKKKTAKKTPAKRRYKKRTQKLVDGTDAFTVEEAPPPLVRGATPEKLKILAKVEKTLHIVQPGQAFIIPTEWRHTIERYLKRHYPVERFEFNRIPDNPDAMRIYRLAWDKNAPRAKKGGNHAR